MFDFKIGGLLLQNQDEITDDSNTNRARRNEIAETNEIELSNMNNNV